MPGGAQPYAPVVISMSVPHTPTATASQSTEPHAGVGIVDVLELRRVGAVRFDGDRAHEAMLAEMGAGRGGAR